jgi:hypothetical protein
MGQRFEEPTSAAAPHLNSADRAKFKSLMLEAKAVLEDALGPLNNFSTAIFGMTQLPGFGVFNPPSAEQLDEAISIIEGGLNQVHRKQNRSTTSVAGSPDKLPYVDPRRIQELQALKTPKWDPRRLVGMLQEINIAHANDMHMATAMLVRAVTDHVPPIFGLPNFGSVAAQHTAGSKDGKSFKGAVAPLAESMKHVADGILHVHIRRTEVLPSSTQVDYRQSLDALLGEVVRLLRQ